MLKPSAQYVNVQFAQVAVADAAEIERAVDAMSGGPSGGLLVMPDSFTMSHRQVVNTRCLISTALPSQYRFNGDRARDLQAFARKLKRKPNRPSEDRGGR